MEYLLFYLNVEDEKACESHKEALTLPFKSSDAHLQWCHHNAISFQPWIPWLPQSSCIVAHKKQWEKESPFFCKLQCALFIHCKHWQHLQSCHIPIVYVRSYNCVYVYAHWVYGMKQRERESFLPFFRYSPFECYFKSSSNWIAWDIYHFMIYC